MNDLHHASLASGYLRPFERLISSGARGLAVTHSLKLRRGAVDGDRYFLRFDEGSLKRRCAVELACELGMPRSAAQWAELQLSGARRLCAVGAAIEGGVLGYRFYYRTGIEHDGAVYGVGVDWSPDSERYAVKTYTLRSAATPQAAGESIRRALRPDPDEARLIEGWLELLSGLCTRLQLLEVSDAASGRRSFDAAPAYERPQPLAEVLHAAVPWLRALGIAGSALEPHADREGALENLAIGRDRHGELFATLYHGRYRRPVLGRQHATLLEATAGQESPCESRVYAIGRVGVDRELAALRPSSSALPAAIRRRLLASPAELASALQEDPALAALMRWSFEINGFPVYAIEPEGPFADTTYGLLAELLLEQVHPDPALRVHWVVLAGHTTGQQRTRDGRLLPVVAPDPNALRSWSREALLGSLPDTVALPLVSELLARLWYEQPNPGCAPEHRALNFLATQPLALSPVLAQAAARGLSITHVEATASSRRSPRAVCQVRLHFEARPRALRTAHHIAELCIDVERTVPAFVGEVRLDAAGARAPDFSL